MSGALLGQGFTAGTWKTGSPEAQGQPEKRLGPKDRQRRGPPAAAICEAAFDDALVQELVVPHYEALRRLSRRRDVLVRGLHGGRSVCTEHRVGVCRCGIMHTPVERGAPPWPRTDGHACRLAGTPDA